MHEALAAAHHKGFSERGRGALYCQNQGGVAGARGAVARYDLGVKKPVYRYALSKSTIH